MKKLLSTVALVATLVSSNVYASECNIPENLHSYSKSVLQQFEKGLYTTEDFLRSFSMPKSHYGDRTAADIAMCVAKEIDPNGYNFMFLPFSVKMYILNTPSQEA